jgi:cytochrome o ubiquinol oxidase subunit 3
MSQPAMTQETRVYYLHEEPAHHDNGTTLGFWIYLMSDALLFAGLFATFGVLSKSFAGGPAPHELFDLGLVAINTAILLASAFTCGLAMISMQAGRVGATRAWLAVTALLGASFVAIELHEFSAMAAEGATPQTSAYLSAFFTLVGTHGLHVTIGVAWILVMLVQLGQRGLHHENRRRLMCLSMFWHFLDVIWIGVFSFVYLMGVL